MWFLTLSSSATDLLLNTVAGSCWDDINLINQIQIQPFSNKKRKFNVNCNYLQRENIFLSKFLRLHFLNCNFSIFLKTKVHHKVGMHKCVNTKFANSEKTNCIKFAFFDKMFVQFFVQCVSFWISTIISQEWPRMSSLSVLNRSWSTKGLTHSYWLSNKMFLKI